MNSLRGRNIDYVFGTKGLLWRMNGKEYEYNLVK
jgi:hypothetical protein